MGFLTDVFSGIDDLFLGGSQKKAAQMQQDALGKGQRFMESRYGDAREDLANYFPKAQQAQYGGFSQAADLLKGLAPQQLGALTSGTQGAQQTIASSLPQIQAALLGGNVDFNAFAPRQAAQPDLSFLNNMQLQQPQQLYANQVEQPMPEGGAQKVVDDQLASMVAALGGNQQTKAGGKMPAQGTRQGMPGSERKRLV